MRHLIDIAVWLIVLRAVQKLWNWLIDWPPTRIDNYWIFAGWMTLIAICYIFLDD